MWAASARPVRRLNARRQVSTVPVSDFVAVAVNTPVARRTFPFGFGTSCRALRAALIVATVPS